MVKGKITMYRIIFFIRQLNILIKKKKNRISIAIFPKKKKKKKKSVALSFFGKSLWDKPFFFLALFNWNWTVRAKVMAGQSEIDDPNIVKKSLFPILLHVIIFKLLYLKKNIKI